jgi:hypothetical protein
MALPSGQCPWASQPQKAYQWSILAILGALAGRVRAGWAGKAGWLTGRSCGIAEVAAAASG